MTTATSRRISLKEYASDGTAHRVDRQAGIIYGVKIIGHKSRNGRTYSDRALTEGLPMYEGKRVCINHPERSNPNRERGIAEHFGVLRNVRKESGGLRGDLHYVKSHALAEQVADMAESQPDQLGLSHNAEGDMDRTGKIVESIVKVHSVDLVLNPATNRGLFEAMNDNHFTITGTDPQEVAGQVETFVNGVVGELAKYMVGNPDVQAGRAIDKIGAAVQKLTDVVYEALGAKRGADSGGTTDPTGDMELDPNETYESIRESQKQIEARHVPGVQLPWKPSKRPIIESKTESYDDIKRRLAMY